MTDLYRGVEISTENDVWVYADTKEPLPAWGGKYRCGKCGAVTNTGHDKCLGMLPGVVNACCGHGDPKQAYIMFENGIAVRGFDIIESTEDYGK